MLADRVTALRLERGWSRPQLAEVAGLTRDQIAKIERGDNKNPKRETLCKLRAALKTTIDDLIDCPDERAA